MTDDRKRNTGGEVEPEELWLPTHVMQYYTVEQYTEQSRALAESRAEVEQLRGLLQNLMNAAPGAHRCLDFHHAKADRHFATEDCGPLRRWGKAWESARTALSLEPNP